MAVPADPTKVIRKKGHVQLQCRTCHNITSLLYRRMDMKALSDWKDFTPAQTQSFFQRAGQCVSANGQLDFQIPDCAYQLGIPRAQRQYLGNWQTEPTGYLYQGEKERSCGHLVQGFGKDPRGWFATGDGPWRPCTSRLGWQTQRVSLIPMDLSWSNRMLRLRLIESEGGPNSATTQHTSSSRRTRAAAKSSELLRPLFQEIFADEVAPPVGPLIVVASLRKTGNPPKRKLHLLDRDGRAVGCGWSPDLTKVSSMTKDDYDSEAAELLHCSRCFHRFRLPSDWGVQDAPAQAVDSDSSVSLSSLTDSSVDTASNSEKIPLAFGTPYLTHGWARGCPTWF